MRIVRNHRHPYIAAGKDPGGENDRGGGARGKHRNR